MKYPELLRPESMERILLPSRKLVEVPKTTAVFSKWRGDPPEDTYGGKPILSFRGEPVFAELAILQAFQHIGWDGVWVDTFGGKYRVGYWGTGCTVELPPEQEALLGSVYERAGAKDGCWDVFCWKDELRLFAEAKRQGRDQIRESQRRWLEAAIAVGLRSSAFLVVEWSV